MCCRIEDRRIPVGIDERGGHRTFGLPRSFRQHRADGGGVQLPEVSGSQDRVEVDHLEQVEQQVADIALVVTHEDLS